MSNPIAVAIGELQASLLRGEVPSIVIDTDAIEPMDDDDKAALRYFFEEPE